jgi:hypothetical protein
MIWSFVRNGLLAKIWTLMSGMIIGSRDRILTGSLLPPGYPLVGTRAEIIFMFR